jgi:hypothetical protein
VSDNNPTEEVRKIMRELRSAAAAPGAASSAHLDDDAIATIVNGIEPNTHRDAIAHLSGCGECRERLTAIANLLDDSSIAAEVERLDSPARRIAARRWSPARWGAVGTLAAAAVLAIVFVGPDKLNVRAGRSVVSSEMRREGTVTTTAPPRILSPAAIDANDSLRWTSVPSADLYRVQVWDREGTVVLAMDTRDTSLALPAQLTRAGGSYLWEVKARTGWDRWVSSDFLEFTIRSPSVP